MPGPAKGPAKAAGAEGRRGLLVQGTGLAAAGLGACCGSPACQAAAAAAARGERGFLGRTYDRVQAWAMGSMMDKYEVEIAPVKRRLFADLADSERALSIVELGIGAGPNLQYYARPDRADRIVGVDVNRAMFGYAKAKIDALEAGTGPGPKIDLVIGDAEATGLADASADAVVATLLLCSVADQAKVLSEINRVLKPGGR